MNKEYVKQLGDICDSCERIIAELRELDKECREKKEGITSSDMAPLQQSLKELEEVDRRTRALREMSAYQEKKFGEVLKELDLKD